MVTTAATQTEFIDALVSVIRLDYDAIEAYDEAVRRIDDADWRANLVRFKADHVRHTEELGAIVEELGGTPPDGPGAKRLVTAGKVVMADLMGDKAILQAMKTNEDDTNAAYERLAGHQHKLAAAADAVERGLADERRHRAWIERAIATL